jgi:hypothetical protein
VGFLERGIRNRCEQLLPTPIDVLGRPDIADCSGVSEQADNAGSAELRNAELGQGPHGALQVERCGETLTRVC